jgi:hypothetical protein
METAYFENETAKKLTIFDADLNLDRTKRIYKALHKLSDESVQLLKNGAFKEFSFSTDRMRPLMAYINDNSLLISKHLDNEDEKTYQNDIKDFASSLTQNIRTINKVQETMNQIDFNPVFFLSEQLLDAYLDYQIPLSWEFHHDLIIILNLDNRVLLDSLVLRGQKRIFILNGSIDLKEVSANNNYPPDVTVHQLQDHSLLKDLILEFNNQPPRRFLALDCGTEKTDPEEMEDIKKMLERGREAAWIRFNTINRGDAVKILDNLGNIIKTQQTSDFHNKFNGQSAIIVCPGPSLSKNIDVLKKAKGKILIISVLHAFKALKEAGIIPDIIIHTDPGNLQAYHYKKDGKDTSYWTSWVEENDFSEVSFFITTSMGAPQMFNIPAEKVLWMSPGQKIGKHLPVDIFDYNRVGGSVSHSAFDLMVEFGFESIALVGQDLAFAKDGELYADDARLDLSDKRLFDMGRRFHVKGFFGDEVETNNTFYFFGQSYERFARELEDTNVKLYNCTEGGMYLNGFEHCELRSFIEKYSSICSKNNIYDIFDSVKKTKTDVVTDKKSMQHYVTKNLSLGNEIATLIQSAMEIAVKGDYSDQKIIKFDKIQNKVIKKLKRNHFFELGLQKELYMLVSGLGADRSVEGQIAFHSDFLKSVKKFNQKFRRALQEQLRVLKSH